MINYVKMIFEKSSSNFYIGAITDGYYKLSVLITMDGEFEDDFTYGSQIKVTGRMRVVKINHHIFQLLQRNT